MNEDIDIQPILPWLKERQASYPVTVEEVGVNELQGWHVDPKSGNITHESGKFFSIVGVLYFGRLTPQKNSISNQIGGVGHLTGIHRKDLSGITI